VRVLLTVAALALAAGCSRRSPESGVTSVVAHIDGLTCPTCIPPLRNSLKRQYAASDVDVNDDKDTASVTFAGDDGFSPANFNAAVERVRMRVVSLQVRACGELETRDGQTWMTAGKNRFLVRSERQLPGNGRVCAEGTLDTRGEPATYQVSSFSENR
jgi:hypothetical protein